ncbi:transport protein Trs120 or TRAPPC9 TRAPP II complex subunit-domain-containing protein [Russula vinacea]|nr:transport protein Trs120 or TRAPPC9 TRAPP II complex subunit-domain-containing protein [Russula vinacea]
MEYNAFASLAHFRILLLPVGSISRKTFDQWATEIRTLENLRLSDIPPGTKDEKARFMPSPKSKGYLHLCFPTHPPSSSHFGMSLFRPSHFPLGVIGIATCSQTDSLSSITAEFNAVVKDHFPPDCLYPLAKSCFATISLACDHPSMMGNKKENIETLLADLCSNILAEFSTVLARNEYLNGSLFPTLPSAADFPMPLVDEEPESLFRLPSHNSQPSFLGPMLGAKRNPSSVAGQTTASMRQSSLGPPTARKRQTIIGAASSHGRLFKVLGDLFLLAGRTEDASVWYTEAVALFKTSNDPVWYASALEGLATVALVEVSGQGFLEQAISLYAKPGPLSESDQRFDLLAYIYTVAILRQGFLLFSTWAAKGWGPLAFTVLMHPGPAPYVLPTLSHPDSTHLMAAVISQAHGPWLLHLGHRERMVILESIAYLYSSLGYRRKEVYILREVVGCIMDLVVCAREQAEPAFSSGITVNGKGSGDSGAVAVKGIERSTGNESVLKLVKHICDVHGINLEAVRFVDTANDDTNSDDLLEDPYGWPELQIGIVREALSVAEALPDPPSVAQFSLSALKALHTVLSDDDQYHMYNMSHEALTAARRRGETRLIDYWSGRPVISIELLQPPMSRSLVESPISILARRKSEAAGRLPQMTDPFLYNPRKSGNTLVVTDEPLEFVLTLYNPFVFDLEIQSLSLSTSGVSLDTKPISVTVPASSYHPVTLSGKPLEDGILVIKGCHVQAPRGAPREFLLPLATADEEEHRSRRQSLATCESGRTKYSGLDSRPGNLARGFLECTVVPEQPLLRIRWSSLTHGAVMLYNGEGSTFRLTLENVSNLPVDFLRLSFDDSTMAPARAALTEGDLSVYEVYETEHQLINRPVFSWDREREDTEIPPGRKVTIDITCTGKVGCTNGCIFISYGYLRRPQSNLSRPSETFHTRQVSYPVLVTVYHMLECHNMDIFPLVVGDYEAEKTPANRSQALFNGVEEEGWCLFTIDVRNTYGLPFEVILERVQKGVTPASTNCVVAPGAMKRMILPLKKIQLPEEVTSQAIPMLSDRQFVVEKMKLSVEEDKLQRELFWYREELFKSVHGHWREAGGSRSGELSFREQQMTLPMLEILRTESARIHLELFRRGSEGDEERIPILRTGGTYYPAPYEFVYLRICITNLSLQPLVVTADTIVDPADHAIQEGPTSGMPIGRLESGAERELETPLCFVACGRFRVHQYNFCQLRGVEWKWECAEVCSSESTSQQVTPGQIESIDIQMAVNLTRLPAAQWMGVYPFIIINLSFARRSWGGAYVT